MRLTVTHSRRDLIEVEVHRTDLRVRLWRKHPAPAPAPAQDEDEGSGFHRGSSLADSSRPGWTPSPDTRVFGFGRR